MLSFAVVILLLTTFSGLHCIKVSSKTDSLMSFLGHFNATRNTKFNSEAKQRARSFVASFFKESGLETWAEEFPSNDGVMYPGINVVGVIPGRHYQSKADKIFILGTHYDTVASTPGVDDNGSGMAALLQSVKQFTAEDREACPRRDYTMMFVAFDLEESQPSCGNSSCGCRSGSIVCGSTYFVRNLTAYLNSTGSQLQGAVVLDTVMNYNTTENSQIFPSGMQQFFDKVYRQEQSRSFRGDFVAVIGREDDSKLLESLTDHYNLTTEYRHLPIQLPFQGIPTQLLLQNFGDFFRSDHAAFWLQNHKTIWLTDTANFRGFMVDCYHQACDNMNHVTPESLGFLSKTADVITAMAKDFTSNRECGGVLNKTTKGELTSKYYPCAHPNRMDCVWTIHKPAQYLAQDYYLALTLEDFQLEDSKNCSLDFLEIRKGVEKSSPLIGKFCGSKNPTTFKTKEPAFRLHFHTNKVKAAKGFKVSWDIKKETSKAGMTRAQTMYLAMSLMITMATFIASVF